MKKSMAGLIIILMFSGAGLAQRNTISGGMGLIPNVPLLLGTEAYLDYEREIDSHFSIVANISGQFYPLGIVAYIATYGQVDMLPGYTIEAQARWYPSAGSFYIDGGIGFHQFLGNVLSLPITAGIGWKIKLGSSPVRMNIEVLRFEGFVPICGNPIKYETEEGEWQEINPFNFLGVRLGLGFAF